MIGYFHLKTFCFEVRLIIVLVFHDAALFFFSSFPLFYILFAIWVSLKHSTLLFMVVYNNLLLTTRRKTIPLQKSLVIHLFLLLLFFSHSLYTGSGSFGSVKKAVRLSDGKEVAIKIIPKRNVKNHFDMVKDEVSVLGSLDHPNVIGFYDSFESR